MQPAYVETTLTKMENNLFHKKQMTFPARRATVFLFSEPFNGKYMHIKRTLKRSNAKRTSLSTYKMYEKTVTTTPLTNPKVINFKVYPPQLLNSFRANEESYRR